MRRKFVVKALAMLLSASVILTSFSSGMGILAAAVTASAVNNTTTGNSDASVVVNSAVAIEGDQLLKLSATGITGGTGTQADPYLINNVSELLAVSNYVNDTTSGDKYFRLEEDIDLSSVSFSNFSNYEDIYALISATPSLSGNADVYFDFDGNGKKLYNLNITVPTGIYAVGLFGYVNSNSSVRNLTFENVTVTNQFALNVATAIGAVQNYGTISDCTFINPKIDLSSSASSFSDELKNLTAGRLYTGYAVVVSDNNGIVDNCNVAVNNSDSGIILVKGDRRFIGGIVGQNRNTVTDCTVSGLRIYSYGSDDSTQWLGSGKTASFIGAVAGRNNARANRTSPEPVITDCTVNLTNALDLVYGDYVGGIAGYNAGVIERTEVNGNHSNHDEAPSSSSADMYGFGRYGGIAGGNSGKITSSGAYDIGFTFSLQSENNSFGGIVGFNSGVVDGCVASGYANNATQNAASVGGIIGNVQSGTSVTNTYAFVKVSVANEYSAAVLGKNATLSHLGTSNYWSSLVSGVSYPVPNNGVNQNEITCSVSVLNVPMGTGGIIVSGSSVTHSGSDATITFDLSKTVSVSSSDISVTSTSTNFRLISNVEGACGELYYYANVVLPDGIGISGKTISQRFSIPVIVSASATQGAGTSSSNPILITTYTQLKFIKNAPSAHYKLAADINTDNTWTPFAFSGTLDGDGHTIYVKSALFTDVSGSRNADISSDSWKNNASNLASGCIRDLNIVATSAVNGAIFRNVRNATLENINYSASSGGFSQLSAVKSGAFINEIGGNVYINKCYVSVPVLVSSVTTDGSAALIGYASADNFIIDNCGTSSIIESTNNISKLAGLIGYISAVNGKAVVSNNYATGSVYVNGTVATVFSNIMIGAVESMTNITFSNNYYSVAFDEISGYTVSKKAAPGNIGSVTEFDFADGAYDVAMDAVTTSRIELIMPSDMVAVADLNVSDFAISFASADVRLVDGTLAVNGNVLSFEVVSTVTTDFSTTVTVKHNPTGFVAETTLRSGLRLVGGYFEIYTVEDLRDIAEGFNDSAKVSTYKAANYKLCADIDMTGETIPLMASTAADAFTGSFVGKDIGDEKYTISNLTITGTETAAGVSAIGLFCYANGATFSNFALENVSVVNAGTGSGLIVGYADDNSATSCKFNNIDINNCSVVSTYKGGTTISLTNMAEAGVIVGSVRSTSANCEYVFKNITVKNTSVKNENIGGSYAVGGLIGSSCAAGTVVIGTAEGTAFTEPSIVIDDLELDGYGFVGGIIGIAGGLPNATSTGALASTAKGGIVINNVLVKNSSILARQGYVGGILGTEGCVAGAAKIINSTVENTTVSAASAGESVAVTSTVADAGGVAGHMAGLIENCTVDSCTVKSCFAGGILGRSSRRGNTHEGTNVTINNCQVIGKTEITDNGVGTANEFGGIIANARTCSATVTNCGVGPDVHIHGTADYAGGIMGACLYTSTTTLYDVTIKNCVTYATVELEDANTTAAAGGIIGLGNMNVAFMDIINCVSAGEVNCNGGYCGGVIGYYNRTVKGTTANDTLIIDCTVTALLNVNSNGIESFTNNANNTAKLVGRTGTYNVNNWMGTTIATAVNGNVISSYPQDIRVYGYAGAYDIQTRNAAYVDTFTDVNKPNGNYLNGNSTGVVIDGSLSTDVDVVISNEAALVGFDNTARLVFDASNDETLLKVNGWNSVSNGILVVTDATVGSADADATVSLTAKKNSTATGFTGSYYVPGFKIPGTDDNVLVQVMIPVVCQNISAFNLDGTGTEGDPYVIMNKDDLDAVRFGSASAHYVLGADIEFVEADFAEGGFFYNNGTYFAPITFSDANDAEVPFTGSFSGYYNGTLYYLGGLKMNSSSSNTALFAEADGAVFEKLYLDNFNIKTSSGNAAVVVATADNVEFDDIQIYSSTISGTAYAGTVAAYVTDADTDKITIKGSTLSSANYIGGVFGHATASSNSAVNEITNSNLTDINITSVAPTDINTVMDIAAGVVGEFSGTLDNVTVDGKGTINGSRASGAVGRVGLETDAIATVIRNVKVDGKYSITSSRSSQKAAAAGILAKINDELIDESESDSLTVNLTISDCYVGKNIDISAYYNAGGVIGSAESWKRGSVRIENTDTFAYVTASLDNGANGFAGAIIGLAGDISVITVSNCTAGGTVTGAEAAGGIIGMLYDYYHTTTGETSRIYNITEPIISNTVVSSKVTTRGIATAPAKGVIIGKVADGAIPSGLTVVPFSNIYYSSYQFGLTGITGNNTVNAAGYDSGVCDLQKNFAYTDGVEILPALPISGDGLVLSDSSVIVGENGQVNTGAVTGNFKHFTVPQNIEFTLEDILSVDSLGQPKDIFSFDKETFTLTLTAEGSGIAAFRYDNGLELSLNVTTFDIDGAGSADNPYIITNVAHLIFVKDYPNKYFVLGADIDFATDENGSTWPDAWFERESGWAENGITFTGSFSGTYYEFDEATGEYTDTEKTYAIKNLVIESDSAVNVGFFSVLEGSLTDIIFENCTFSSTAANSNAGAAAGTNNGTISGVVVSDSDISAVNSAGAVAGYSLTEISECNVSSNTTVTANHVAGGIAGTALTVTDSSVTSATITASDYAGGITASNINSSDKASSYTGCEVSDTDISASLATGGILAYAEIATANGNRGLTVENCIVNNNVTVTSSGTTNSMGKYYSYAAGIVGRIDDRYDSIIVRTNESYATVTANGDVFGNADSAQYTAAGAIVGSTSSATGSRPATREGVLKFTFVNNVAGGVIRSANLAGGFAGKIAFGASQMYRIKSGDFICHNIISAVFETVPTVSEGTVSNENFAVLCSFIENNSLFNPYDAACISNNYYSSYVSELGNPGIRLLGSSSEITECGITDISVAANGSSSFKVKNNRYEYSAYEVDENGEYVRDDKGFIIPAEGAVETGVLGLDSSEIFFEDTVIGYHFEEFINDRTYTKPVQFVFEGSDIDLGIIDSEYLVYNNNDITRALSIKALSVSPMTASSYYESTLSSYGNRIASSFTVLLDEETEASLVADLGYGLKVGIVIAATADGSVANGSISSPYLIKNASDFAYYFFGSFAKNVENDYLRKYYRQTENISFNDIVTEIALLDPSTAISNTFAPIGNATAPFQGGYDGNEKVITDFVYVGSDADTGLFGYVSGSSLSESDYRLRDIHIELGAGGVSGGEDTGGLVGHYDSDCEIYNCSVVYSTVTGALNVGGLVGNISDTTLDGCFTSTDVRVYDETVSNSESGVGGLVGYLSKLTTTEKTLNFINCFSSSDAVAYMNVAGFVGRIYHLLGSATEYGKVNLGNCSFTGSVTAMRLESAATTTDPISTSIVVGHFTTGATGAGRMRKFVTATNVIVAGTNTTEYATSIMSAGDSQSRIFYPVLFGTAPLSSGSNVYYDASVTGRISVPNDSTTDSAKPYQLWVSGDVYDITGTDMQTSDGLLESIGITNSNTEELVKMNSFGDPSAWDCSDDSLYPVLIMHDRYSNAFAKMSAMPLSVDSREADDSDEDNYRDYKSLTYPLTVNSVIGESQISFTSSTYSASSDTVLYDPDYDTGLFGNGSTDRASSDMKTDILFKNSEDGIKLLRNSYLDSSATTGRNEKSPYVTLSAEIDGFSVNRNVRIPLRGEDNAVFIATERQLRAIMNSRNGGIESSGKFFDAYNGALTKNVYLCADIDLNEKVKFTPISGYGAYSLVFEGSDCIISGLYIDTGKVDTGLFDVLQTNNLEIKNIVLRNVNVNGLARTGALVGSVNNNVLLNNCLVITDEAGDYKVSGTTGVGGLVGWMEAGFIGYESTESTASQYTPDQVSGASVSVEGTNFVGGFVGYAKGATISNSFATGDVTRIYNPSLGTSNYFSNGVSGFGGFVGYAELNGDSGKIQYTFASGDVKTEFSSIDTTGSSSGFTVGVGGFAGIAKMGVQNCFSMGNVTSSISNISSNNGVEFGAGGLVGYSDNVVTNAYSSSVVEFDLSSSIHPTLAGVGGVVGISKNSVQYVYSSGSIWSSLIDSTSTVKLGGVVGSGNVVDRVYYDTWTNNIESLAAVGNIADGEYIRGFTTEEFCNGTLVTENYLTSAEWGYDKSENPNAYPYLKEFCFDHVSDYVRYPAVLSVVAVRPNDRDEAVREGRGYSMALTMPTSLTMDYIDASGDETVTTPRIYNLEWEAGSELGADNSQYAGGLIKYGNNTFAPIRTSNTEQYLQLVAYVKSYEENNVVYDNNGAAYGYKEYGTREISKLYQMMLGTEEYPYLISTSLDLRHIGFTVNGGNISNQNGDFGQYPDFYDRWYSPINIENLNENIQGKVYFKLISNVDMTKQIVINEDGTASVETVENVPFPTIPNMLDNQYSADIKFAGIEIDGDDYAIVNFVSNGSLIESLDADSKIENVIFDNITISADSGDVAIVGTNNGTVDGLIVMGESSMISTDNGSAAAAVAVNNGTINNAVAASNVSGSKYVGGVAAENYGTISVSVSDSDLTALPGTLGIGGIAGLNEQNAVISETVSLGNVFGAESLATGGFAGENKGTISDGYSRTAVNGTFETAGSFCGVNAGTISNAFSAGKTIITGTDASSKGSAFAGKNSGTLDNAYADKALLSSHAYMLIADSATTEDIVAGVCFDTDAFEYCESGKNSYPVVKALAAGDPEEKVEETKDGYEMIKYRLLEAYSVLATVTVDSAYANYIDLLAPAQNKVSAVPEGYTVTPSGVITSGNGTVTAAAPTVSQKIGAGTNTQDDISYNLTFSFDYSVTADGQNPNFKDGIGSDSDPFIIETNGDYTAESSFESLAYFGKANDASFRMAEDVSFDGKVLYSPIEKMAGSLDGNGFTVNDITVESNTALIGEITGSVKNLGITGVKINAVPTESETNFGLLAARADGAEISNVFAVGELKIAASEDLSANVGGLVGYLKDSTVYSVVTSGYIRNDATGEDSTVGGVAGLIDGGTLSASESTAYVFGDVTVGGIAGTVVNADVSEVIFAGTVSDTVLSDYDADVSSDTAVIGQIVGNGTANEAYYDKQVALFTDDNANARSTSQLVRLTLNGFTNDTASMKYYPNPVSVSETSDAFKAGLNFALARINVSLAGGEGALNCYDQVSVTSPVNKTADTVSMIEDRTRFDDENSYMTASTSSSLLPNGGSARGFTGVKATLNNGADSSYEGNVNDIYRYTEVYIVRVIEIDYVLIDNTVGDVFGNDTNVGLMIRPEMDGALKITSNAVTSINEDADTSSGSYAVKFNKIVVSGNGFTVDTLLPEGFDFEPFISASDEANGYSGSISEENGNYVELGNTDKVKLYVAISEADEVWGLQSADGGLN